MRDSSSHWAASPLEKRSARRIRWDEFLCTGPTDEPQPPVSVTRSQSASNALENVSDEVFRAPKAVAPLCVWGGGRLCSDNFVERFPLFLQSRHFLSSANEQVAIKRELRFVANCAVAWDDNHLVGDFRQVGFGGADHAVDAAAR